MSLFALRYVDGECCAIPARNCARKIRRAILPDNHHVTFEAHEPDNSARTRNSTQLSYRPKAELATSPLIAHAPLAVAVTVTTASVADALLLALVGLFAGLSVFTPPELVPFVSHLLAGSAFLLVVIRVGFSLAMWSGARAARAEPTAIAMLGLTRTVVGRWWWTAAMALIMFGVAASLVVGWPKIITGLLAVATMAFGIGRAVFIMLLTRRTWTRVA